MRVCDKCGKDFNAKTKHGRICEECKKPTHRIGGMKNESRNSWRDNSINWTTLS